LRASGIRDASQCHAGQKSAQRGVGAYYLRKDGGCHQNQKGQFQLQSFFRQIQPAHGPLYSLVGEIQDQSKNQHDGHQAGPPVSAGVACAAEAAQDDRKKPPAGQVVEHGRGHHDGTQLRLQEIEIQEDAGNHRESGDGQDGPNKERQQGHITMGLIAPELRP